MLNGIIFRQLFDATTSTYTYLLACPETNEALLIDPVYEQVGAEHSLTMQTWQRLHLNKPANTTMLVPSWQSAPPRPEIVMQTPAAALQAGVSRFGEFLGLVASIAVVLLDPQCEGLTLLCHAVSCGVLSG